MNFRTKEWEDNQINLVHDWIWKLHFAVYLISLSISFVNSLNQKSWISEESRAAVEKLIRRCRNVDISSDRRQDVCINTQMLNGWRMSEWKVAAAVAKIHSFGRETQVHIPASATRYEHMVKWTWHQSRWTDVNPGQIITSVSERTFFHLISVF